ncbi:hypothetical protein [Streptomyces sp. NPDC091217]|uniref:hypothetical protein n=1 Tax=Streptomyces sp. NPDC091217 TaxID=3365975 RepID=UPI00381FE4F3
MVSDQTADLARIKESARSLSRIHKEFAGNANPAHGLGVSVFGEKGLVDVFDDFGDNWRVHRGRLTEELEKLSEILTAAAKGYEDIDHQLAEALRGTDAKPSQAGGGAR